jgi:hypothetical protein
VQRSLLIPFFFILMASSAQAQWMCTELFPVTVSASATESGLIPSTRSLSQEMQQDLAIFGRRRARAREFHKIEHELEHVEHGLARRMEQDSQVREIVEQFEAFNQFWLQKIQEFRQLSPQEQRRLAPLLEIPLSIGTKHMISFLEDRHHVGWKLHRLRHFLTLHQEHSNLGLEAHLFLMDRAVKKYYTRWDYTRCRY